MRRPALPYLSMKRPALLLCLALALPVPTWAGMFDDEEARKQIKDLRAELTQSVDTLRQRVEGVSKNQLDFANQIEALRSDVARLTGQIEVLTNSLEAAHKRQRDFYVDLDNRLRKLEAAGTAAPQEPAAPKTDPQAEMRDYEAALGQFRAAKFKEAQAAFEGFIVAYPKAALLPNAHYWLGSSLYQQKQFGKAAETYGKVATTWPTDPKAPDALLARANAQIEARDEKAAIQTLQTLIEKYPTSPAVETARARLKTLQPPPVKKR
ncbi:MAG: tol-pal system protein YbgF [Rhodocyclaceae bacterium]|nr:tol-pal system protein YbgF [Rhodocyclaceae bacterium]